MSLALLEIIIAIGVIILLVVLGEAIQSHLFIIFCVIGPIYVIFKAICERYNLPKGLALLGVILIAILAYMGGFFES